MIRFRHASESVRIVDCMPEVILINSHDSSSSFQLPVASASRSM